MKNVWFVAGDIGGTKALLALFRQDGAIRNPVFERRYPSALYSGPGAIIREFVASCEEMPSFAVIAIAGPVEDGRVNATNLGWQTDSSRAAAEAGLQHVVFINDLEAAVYGIPALDATDFFLLSPGHGENERAPFGIVAPGTGLGEAAGIWCEERLRAVATEGGHASFAPCGMDGAALFRFMTRRQGHVSVEDLCSGRGLVNLYRFLLEKNREGLFGEQDILAGDIVPGIVENALEGRCRTCSATIGLFLDILASEAGNMALRFLASGGIFISGGIAPRIIRLVDRKRFAEIFMAKGPMSEWLGGVPLKIVLDNRLPLYGAAAKGMEYGPIP